MSIICTLCAYFKRALHGDFSYMLVFAHTIDTFYAHFMHTLRTRYALYAHFALTLRPLYTHSPLYNHSQSGASYSKVRKTHFFSRLNNTVNDEEGESIWVKTIDLMIDQNKVDHFTSGNFIIFMHCMKSLTATKIDKSLPNTEFFSPF